MAAGNNLTCCCSLAGQGVCCDRPVAPPPAYPAVGPFKCPDCGTWWSISHNCNTPRVETTWWRQTAYDLDNGTTVFFPV